MNLWDSLSPNFTKDEIRDRTCLGTIKLTPTGMKDTEIELKFEINNSRKLETWLKENAQFKSAKHQIDNYYTPPHRNFFDVKYPVEYLRVRHAKNDSITYKFWHAPNQSKEHSHCDEFETKVENGQQIEKIFEALNFRMLVAIDKKRKSYKYQNFEIEVDEVKDLGTFCEIEIKGLYKSVDDAKKQIWKLAKQLGFTENDRGDDLKLGYVYLLAKQKGLLKQLRNL